MTEECADRQGITTFDYPERLAAARSFLSTGDRLLNSTEVQLVYDSKFKPHAEEKLFDSIADILRALNWRVSKIEILRLNSTDNYLAKVKRDPFWYDREVTYIPIEGEFSFSTDSELEKVVTVGQILQTNHWFQHRVSGAGLVLKVAGFRSGYTACDPRENLDTCLEKFNKSEQHSYYQLKSALKFLIDKLPDSHQQKVAGFCKTALVDWRYLSTSTSLNLELVEAYIAEIESFLQQSLESVDYDNGVGSFKFFQRTFLSALDALKRENSRIDLTVIEPLRSLYDRPVFIVAAPRSGSTMLFELLQNNQKLWTLSDESHHLFESIEAFHPATKSFESNELSAADLTTDSARALLGSFTRKLKNANGVNWLSLDQNSQPSQIRFLEKTPKNALRIPLLKALFPDAKFIFLHRECRANVGSIMNAWNSGRFVTYKNLPGWSGAPWSLLLTPGWQKLNNAPLAEIALHQWASANNRIMSALKDLPQQDWISVNYDGVLQNKAFELEKLCDFIGVPFGPRMRAAAENQGHSKYTLDAPAREKWRKHESEILSALEKTPSAQTLSEHLTSI